LTDSTVKSNRLLSLLGSFALQGTNKSFKTLLKNLEIIYPVALDGDFAAVGGGPEPRNNYATLV
jgi:hypothetical protein